MLRLMTWALGTATVMVATLDYRPDQASVLLKGGACWLLILFVRFVYENADVTPE